MTPGRCAAIASVVMTPRWFLPLACLLALVAERLAAQQPDTLRHSVPAPFGPVRSGEQFGISVATDGGYTVIGTYNAGMVRVFDSTTGVLLHVLVNPNPTQFETFGHSVAISGTRVVVGDFWMRRVYVYDLANPTPTVPVVVFNSSVDQFGQTVAISGTRVVVGAPGNNDLAPGAGRAYVYNLASTPPPLASY